MPKGKGGGGESGGGTSANMTTIILGAITIVLALINKMVPLRSNP